MSVIPTYNIPLDVATRNIQLEVDGRQYIFPSGNRSRYEEFVDACAYVVGGTAYHDTAKGKYFVRRYCPHG